MVCRDIRSLAIVNIENSKELYNNNRTATHVEVTFLFADLVMGPEFSVEDKKSKLFTNHEPVSFLVDFEDFEELLAEMRIALAAAHHSRT